VSCRRLRPSSVVAQVAVVLAVAACSGGDEQSGWTTEQAEAITAVRGLPVDVRECSGIGDADDRRYERLACVAGARLTGEAFDTVAVSFDVVPSSGDAYELENVRFFGGPGIP
jgi:hypothetical protein